MHRLGARSERHLVIPTHSRGSRASFAVTVPASPLRLFLRSALFCGFPSDCCWMSDGGSQACRWIMSRLDNHYNRRVVLTRQIPVTNQFAARSSSVFLVDGGDRPYPCCPGLWRPTFNSVPVRAPASVRNDLGQESAENWVQPRQNRHYRPIIIHALSPEGELVGYGWLPSSVVRLFEGAVEEIGVAISAPLDGKSHKRRQGHRLPKCSASPESWRAIPRWLVYRAIWSN